MNIKNYECRTCLKFIEHNSLKNFVWFKLIPSENFQHFFHIKNIQKKSYFLQKKIISRKGIFAFTFRFYQQTLCRNINFTHTKLTISYRPSAEEINKSDTKRKSVASSRRVAWCGKLGKTFPTREKEEKVSPFFSLISPRKSFVPRTRVT